MRGDRECWKTSQKHGLRQVHQVRTCESCCGFRHSGQDCCARCFHGFNDCLAVAALVTNQRLGSPPGERQQRRSLRAVWSCPRQKTSRSCRDCLCLPARQPRLMAAEPGQPGSAESGFKPAAASGGKRSGSRSMWVPGRMQAHRLSLEPLIFIII